MIRRDAYRSVGGYTVDKKMLRFEDVNLWYKLYAKGYRGHNLEEPLLSAQKNPLLIAECFFELSKIRADCDLIWVGIGEMEEYLKQYFCAQGIMNRVQFLGSRDDVPELMKISDLFLFPSLFEGLGIVLIEAQAAGIPCLVSDTVPKMVDCGGCVFYSIQEKADKWAEKANQILDKRIELNIVLNKIDVYLLF